MAGIPPELPTAIKNAPGRNEHKTSRLEINIYQKI
jgi:hypothetical protein